MDDTELDKFLRELKCLCNKYDIYLDAEDKIDIYKIDTRKIATDVECIDGEYSGFTVDGYFICS